MMVIRIVLILLMLLRIQVNGERSMYVLCPPQFIPVDNICYFMGEERVNWLDAHFECKERNSRLAQPTRKEDRFLRKHLNKLNGFNLDEMWIGARFNWERNKWQWGYNGDDLTYQSFSQMSADDKDLKFHCATLKRKLKYRWSANSCEQQLQYVCQHKIKFVNEKKRHEIHKKWNETYPNQMANEVLHVVSKNDLLTLKSRRSGPHSRARSNSRQTKNEIIHRQIYNIHPKHFAYQKPNRKMLMNARNRTSKQFDLNRYRAQGIRQTINFTSTGHQEGYNRQWRQKQRWNLPSTKTAYSSKENTTTISPNTMTTAIMTTPTTITTRAKLVVSNDVNHYDEQHTENYNYKNLRQEFGRNIYSNILNKATHHTEKSDHTFRQRNDELALQTNEILDNVVVTTTLSPREMKKKKLKSVRSHLNKLSPEQQDLFYKRRAERNKKRGIAKRTPTEP